MRRKLVVLCVAALLTACAAQPTATVVSSSVWHCSSEPNQSAPKSCEISR